MPYRARRRVLLFIRARRRASLFGNAQRPHKLAASSPSLNPSVNSVNAYIFIMQPTGGAAQDIDIFIPATPNGGSFGGRRAPDRGSFRHCKRHGKVRSRPARVGLDALSS